MPTGTGKTGATEMEVPAKFIKLMMMTTSENDGEALNALRMANAQLAAANINWEEFLTLVGTTNTSVAEKSAPPPRSSNRSKAPWEDDDEESFSDVGRNAKGHYTDPDDINRLFELAFRKTPQGSGFRRFLDSVHEWWEANEFLTEKQYEAVRKSAMKR